MPNALERLAARRAAERRAEALPRAIMALEELGARGVDAGVVGSLARDQLKDHSDVDFVILDDRGIFYDELMAAIERRMRPIPIDMILLRWIAPEDRATFLKDLRRADELRSLMAAA
jgi:predicted nucleotidyltransferase